MYRIIVLGPLVERNGGGGACVCVVWWGGGGGGEGAGAWGWLGLMRALSTAPGTMPAATHNVLKHSDVKGFDSLSLHGLSLAASTEYGDAFR